MAPNNNNQLKIGELPQLKIVSIQNIVFHEENNPERTSNIAIQLRKDNILKNPPIVASHTGTKQYLLLDGANRLMALQLLDVQDVLVQIVELSDPGLLLKTWHHAIEKLERDVLLNKISSIPEISFSVVEERSFDSAMENSIFCRIQFNDASVYHIYSNHNLLHKLKLIRGITELYSSPQIMDRVSYSNLEHLKKNYPLFCGVVIFQNFTKDELIEITSQGLRIPSGITRIILPKRALRVNIPLDILRFETSLVEKNHWLRKRIDDQIKEKSIRFYHEPTFLFDE